jgi:hypothetical protein
MAGLTAARGSDYARCALCFPRARRGTDVAAGLAGEPQAIGPTQQTAGAEGRRRSSENEGKTRRVAEEPARGRKAAAAAYSAFAPRGWKPDQGSGVSWRAHGGAPMGSSLPMTTSVSCSQCGQSPRSGGYTAGRNRTLSRAAPRGELEPLIPSSGHQCPLVRISGYTFRGSMPSPCSPPPLCPLWRARLPVLAEGRGRRPRLQRKRLTGDGSPDLPDARYPLLTPRY